MIKENYQTKFISKQECSKTYAPKKLLTDHLTKPPNYSITELKFE